MNTIAVTRFTPYDHIPLSREVVLNSLLPSASVSPVVHLANTAKSKITKQIRPVLVFGEIEWLMLQLTRQESI